MAASQLSPNGQAVQPCWPLLLSLALSLSFLFSCASLLTQFLYSLLPFLNSEQALAGFLSLSPFFYPWVAVPWASASTLGIAAAAAKARTRTAAPSVRVSLLVINIVS